MSGGTRVTIDGDGFLPESTLTFISRANFTFLGSVSYSRIVFTTPPQSIYVNVDLDLSVYVRVIPSVCLLPSCHFSWSRSVTPIFTSVLPATIRGPTNLTINGQNLLAGNNATVQINGNPCQISQLRNDSIRCTVMGVEAGRYRLVGAIEGLFDIRS